MRPPDERRSVRHLADSGLNASQIARSTGIPRSTLRGWLNAGDAQRPCDAQLPYDSCERCGHPVHDFAALPEAEYSYLLGAYLGDGTISAGRRRVYALRVSTDNRYSGVIAEVALAMAAVMPTSRVGLVQRKGCVEIRSHSRSWPCLFPQHGAGPKHTRRIELTHWQAAIVRRRPQQFIRGLLHSDGCRITNFATTRDGRRYEYPRYLFTNASEDIRALFCEALEQVGARYTHPSPRNVSIARAESVRLLDAFVGAKS
jgi:hypothetical protein